MTAADVLMAVSSACLLALLILFVGFIVFVFVHYQLRTQKMVRDLDIKPFPGEVWDSKRGLMMIQSRYENGILFLVDGTLHRETHAEFEVLRAYENRYRYWSNTDPANNETETRPTEPGRTVH